jgi:CRP-like cAMP-binding protein
MTNAVIDMSMDQQGDLALLALAAALDRLTETMATFRAQQDAMAVGLTSRMDRIEHFLGMPAPHDLSGLTEPEQCVVEALVRAYSRSRPFPARTQSIAIEAGYSARHALSILKGLAGQGVIRAVPGRGSRVTGKWLPLNKNIA